MSHVCRRDFGPWKDLKMRMMKISYYSLLRQQRFGTRADNDPGLNSEFLSLWRCDRLDRIPEDRVIKGRCTAACHQGDAQCALTFPHRRRTDRLPLLITHLPFSPPDYEIVEFTLIPYVTRPTPRASSAQSSLAPYDKCACDMNAAGKQRQSIWMWLVCGNWPAACDSDAVR